LIIFNIDLGFGIRILDLGLSEGDWGIGYLWAKCFLKKIVKIYIINIGK